MNTIAYKSLSFNGIRVRDGGAAFVQNNEGAGGLQILEDAQKTYANSQWTLFVDKDGYSLRSPLTCKIYTGPFTMKKQIKAKIDKKLIIRLDESHRARFAIDFPSADAVSKAYKEIKSSVGLEKVLKIFTLLEGQCKRKLLRK